MYWAEQFHNRLLVERLFLNAARVHGEGAVSLENWEPWRWALRPPGGPSFGGGAERNEACQAPHSSTWALAGFMAEAPAVATHPGDTLTYVDVSRDMRRRLLAPEGREPELVELLPENTVWVRTLFDGQGALNWWAWQRSGDQLRLLADGTSKPGARDDLERANLRLDLEIERIWSAYHGWVLDLELEELLEPIQELAHDRHAWMTQFSAEQEVNARLAKITSALEAVAQKAPLLARLGRTILQGQMDEGQQLQEWILEDWRAGLTRFQQPWGPPPAPGDQSSIIAREKQRRHALDVATQHQLDVVGDHLSLLDLGRKLSHSEWAKTDVLFQTEGPLLAAPLAWLELTPGRQLWEAVASSSSVVSLTLRQQAEREARAPENRLLSVHWEEPSRRRPQSGMLQLQSRLVNTGREQGWEVWCLGDDPEANTDNLVAAINDPRHRFGVLVINAHGIEETYGVRLAQDTEWCGSGANLEHIDLVILAACSVGRLRQDGGRDVEGLYAELAAHHGRCVIAARWPIADNETAILVDEIVRQYQGEAADAAKSNLPAVPAFARARALQRARQKLLRNGEISTHLAAAFEIFGWA